MSERERLEQAIVALERQRAELGDDVVDSAQATLREKLSSLAPDKAIAQDTAASPAKARDSERRVVTVLFCDVVGSTAMAEDLDPEQWTGVMNAAFDRLIEPVYRYGGMVARLQGDAMLAFFGAPVAHENDPERACRAALAIIQEAQKFASSLERDPGIAGFNVRIGINTGLTVVGQVGSHLRGEYTAMGDAVNVAARLENAAEPGTILLGENTYHALAGTAEVLPLGPLKMKGKQAPMPVYQLLNMITPQQVRPQELLSPLIGREREQEAMNNCLSRLRNGSGGVLTVIGEAGLGKTRLLEELRRSPSVNGSELTWLVGQTLSYGQNISYWPFHEILWQMVGASEEDNEAEAWRKLESRVRDFFGEGTSEILPYLATLLSIDVRDEYVDRVKFLDGEEMRQQIFIVSRRIFERLARERPLVLVFEDLHWIDESSAHLLEHLLPLVERAPILFCLSSRPEVDSFTAKLRTQVGANFGDRHTELILQPLSAETSRQMLGNLAPIENLTPSARAAIVGKSDGNPFFLEEITRSLVDGGFIVRDELTGSWRAERLIESVVIPDTIQGVIVARLDRLADDVKWVLRAASVIGRAFPHRLLAAILDNGTNLDQHLESLLQAGFIEIEHQAPELEYIFKHALAQETIYESILLAMRRELHGRVGRTIEKLFALRLEEFYGLLAYHFARAEMWQEAQDYLLKSGDQAVDLAADAEALFYYRKALQTYASAGGEGWGPLQRATLERKMAVALLYRGESEAALQAFEKALSYLTNPISSTTWGIRLAILQEGFRQLLHRLLSPLFVAQSYRQPEPKFEEEIRIYEGYSWIDIVANPERLLLVTLRLLNRSEKQGAAWGVAGSSMALAFAMTLIPLRRLPVGYFRRALDLGEAEEMLDIVGLVHHARSWHEAFQGNWDNALTHSRRAAEISQVTGQLLNWAFPRFQIATILAYRGHYEEALDYCRLLVEFGRDAATNQVLCWGLATLGFIKRHQGLFEEAIAASEEAAALARNVPDQGFLIAASAEVGRSQLHRGDLEEALRAFAISEDAYQPFLGPDSYASLRNGLASAHLTAAENNYLGEGAEWLKKARRSCREAMKLSRNFVPSAPEAMRLQGTLEWMRRKPTAAEKWWQRSLLKAEELGQPFDQACTYMEIGRRLSEQETLEKALRIFTELGIEHEGIAAVVD